MLCCLFALLLGTYLGAGAQSIHQWPASKVQLVGSALSLECKVKGTSNPNLYWYRKAAGGALHMLFYSVGVGQVDSEGPQHLSASRHEPDQFKLNAEKLLLEDSGFYLCAWSITLSREGQAAVQKPYPHESYPPPSSPP